MSKNKDEEVKICKKCKEEIKKGASKCPKCGAKQGFPIWIIIVIVVICIIAGASGTGKKEEVTDGYKKNTDVKVVVADMSAMTKAEIEVWCNDNKINCTLNKEYSSTIAKGNVVKQSVSAGKEIYEGEKLEISISLGREPTAEEKNALEKAESYSRNLHMSKNKIYDQLVSYEKYTKEQAQYAVDNMDADWNFNALEKAKSYRDNLNMSKSKVYDQLVSYEKFTKEQAQYAIDHLDE